MELSSLLSGPASFDTQIHQHEASASPDTTHTFPTRNTTMAGMNLRTGTDRMGTPELYSGNPSNMNTPHSTTMSPFGHANPIPKSVAFELMFPESPQYRARLPMRVQIFPHDTTDSIVTTVKNFYGLYAGPAGAKGVSFEDVHGNTLIARYENFTNNMVVYVRVIGELSAHPAEFGPLPYASAAHVMAQPYHSGDAHHMGPPAQALNYGQPNSRPMSRMSRKRSISPGGRGRRSASASTNPLPAPKKSRSQSGFKSRGSSTHGGSFADIHSDGMTGYSSGDGAPGSVSSKTKSEHLGNTEISLDNIVEGGRRKRAKFESSELPLFAPPQMPAATSSSSVSPARRMEHQRSAFPYTNGSHNPFSNPHPLQSPQSYGNGFGQPGMYTTPGAQRRTREVYPGRIPMGTPGTDSAILPTPDPTVGSCMSEEDKDVALQLMRLGEMSNVSHGRTSASTFADDTFSGKADAASSTGATSEDSESEADLPPMRKESSVHTHGVVQKFRQHLDDILPSQDSSEPSGDEGEDEDGADGTFRPSVQSEHLAGVEQANMKLVNSKATSQLVSKPRLSLQAPKVKPSKSHKSQRPANGIKKKPSVSVKGPLSPSSMAPHSRKTSVASTSLNFQHQLGEDEEDLSSKPRCQRCRKSKKGCDRQRPCGRCKDAGLSADQCVSEDEGNGRKGRYGRHMGVPVKKEELDAQAALQPLHGIVGGMGSPDKSKKRKR